MDNLIFFSSERRLFSLPHIGTLRDEKEALIKAINLFEANNLLRAYGGHKGPLCVFEIAKNFYVSENFFSCFPILANKIFISPVVANFNKSQISQKKIEHLQKKLKDNINFSFSFFWPGTLLDHLGMIAKREKMTKKDFYLAIGTTEVFISRFKSGQRPFQMKILETLNENFKIHREELKVLEEKAILFKEREGDKRFFNLYALKALKLGVEQKDENESFFQEKMEEIFKENSKIILQDEIRGDFFLKGTSNQVIGSNFQPYKKEGKNTVIYPSWE